MLFLIPIDQDSQSEAAMQFSNCLTQLLPIFSPRSRCQRSILFGLCPCSCKWDSPSQAQPSLPRHGLFVVSRRRSTTTGVHQLTAHNSSALSSLGLSPTHRPPQQSARSVFRANRHRTAVFSFGASPDCQWNTLSARPASSGFRHPPDCVDSLDSRTGSSPAEYK